MLAIIFGLVAIGIFVLFREAFSHAPTSPQRPKPAASGDALVRFGLGQRRKSQRRLHIEKPAMEFNPENSRALDLLENSRRNIFLTGRAGAGKSTLLMYFRATTKKNVAVVAPTGVAAINVQGQTIHRFFRFKPDITLDKVPKYLDRDRDLYKELDTLVIDEISMVRADLLDCVDAFLRMHGPEPGKVFGGVQMVFMGDLYQLPPVVKDEEEEIFQTHYRTEFFFSAKCLQQTTLIPLELTRVYRQSDEGFKKILNDIRDGTVSDQDLAVLNSRVDRDFSPAQEEGIVRVWLVPTRAQAAEINGWHMEHLPGAMRMYHGSVEGRFSERDMPTPLELELKVGTQVMLLNNDSKGRWVNGDVARVVDLRQDFIRVKFDDGTFDDVERHTWDAFRHTLEKGSNKIVAVSDGSFTQFPVKPAWALTIHKSQGKTYDHVAIDLSRGTFAAGQAYVALSRCRTLEGLILKTPLRRHHVMIDKEAAEFMKVVSFLAEKGHIP